MKAEFRLIPKLDVEGPAVAGGIRLTGGTEVPVCDVTGLVVSAGVMIGGTLVIAVVAAV